MYYDETTALTVVFAPRRYRILSMYRIVKDITVSVPGNLTIELDAAGFDVAGTPTQGRSFTPPFFGRVPFAMFSWNLYPKGSGNFTNDLIVFVDGKRVASASFRIRVAAIWFLTGRQLRILAGVVAVVTALSTFGTFILQLIH